MQIAQHFDDAAVRRLLRLEPLLEGMRRALMDLSAGRVVQPLRMVMEIPAHQGLLFVKPTLTQDALVTKLITQLPGYPARGLPTMLATLVLMDPATGQTLAVMDATWLTALRTAAVSAAAADALTPPGAKVVALLGSGAQARSHADVRTHSVPGFRPSVVNETLVEEIELIEGALARFDEHG